MDKFFKMAHFIPCKKVDDTHHVANMFFKEVVCLNGLPRSTIFYHDTKFLSSFWKTLWGKLGTKLLLSTTCHPQTDGQTEVVNITLSSLLRVVIKKNIKTWEECLPHVEFAYNRVVHNTIQHSPFEIVYELNTLTPFDLLSLPNTSLLNHKYGKTKVGYMRKLYEQVKVQIEKKTKSYAKHANKGKKKVVFESDE